jgi:hypothetical protein
MIYVQTEQLCGKYPLNLPKTNNICLLDNGRMNAVIKNCIAMIDAFNSVCLLLGQKLKW